MLNSYGGEVSTLVSRDAGEFVKEHLKVEKIYNYDYGIKAETETGTETENTINQAIILEKLGFFENQFDLILNCSDNENDMYKYIDIVDSLKEEGWYITLNTTFMKRCDEHYSKAMKGHLQTILNIDRDHDQFIKWFSKKKRNARWALFNDKYASFELDKLKDMAEAGAIKPIIRKSFDLENGKQAFQELMESGSAQCCKMDKNHKVGLHQLF